MPPSPAGDTSKSSLQNPSMVFNFFSFLRKHQTRGKGHTEINSDVLFCKAHTHIFQTQKINQGVNALTDQQLTIMQQEKGNGSAGPRHPTVPAGGSKNQDAESLHTAQENATEMTGS